MVPSSTNVWRVEPVSSARLGSLRLTSRMRCRLGSMPPVGMILTVSPGSNTTLLENVFVPDAAITLDRPQDEWHVAWTVALAVALPLLMSPYVAVAEKAAELAREDARHKAGEPYMPYLLGELENHLTTARVTWREKVAGLRAGADDYLSKPFEFEELLARLEAVIRRSSGHSRPILACGPIKLDTTSARVTLDGNLVNLTALEYRTLEYLMQHKGKVVSKSELTEHIYDQDFDRDSNVIEVLINRLRSKLSPGVIGTRRGLGYQLREPGSVA